MLNSPECNLLDQTSGNSDRGLLVVTLGDPFRVFIMFILGPPFSVAMPEGPDLVQDINLRLLIIIIPNKSK